MIPESRTDIKISQITLSVAKDSGWYEIDLNLGEYYFWGKDKGCDMYNGSCSQNFAEFCNNKNELSCSQDHNYVTICNDSPFTDSCKINFTIFACKVHHSIYDSVFQFGLSSVCLKSKVLLLIFK